MTCHVERNPFRHAYSVLSLGMMAALILCSGCRVFQRRPKPGLLGPRAVVPTPYVAPAGQATAMARAPEPTFTVAPMLPPDVDLDASFIEPINPAPAAPVDTVKPPSTPTIILPPDVKSQRLTYTVKKGDSLWLIAEMYGITVPELAAENSLNSKKILHPGDVLDLPPGARLRDPAEIKRARKPKKTTKKTAKAPKAPRTPRKTPKVTDIPANGMYTVRAGDNLWTIARRFGVRSRDVMAWNNLKTDILQIGQKLRLRKGAGTKAITPVAPGPEAPKNPITSVEKTVDPKSEGDTTLKPPHTEAGGTGGEAKPAAETADNKKIDHVLPVTTPGAFDLPKRLTHTITKGETLQIIADMYGTTIEKIKKENPLVETDADLVPNAKLMVPYQ